MKHWGTEDLFGEGVPDFCFPLPPQYALWWSKGDTTFSNPVRTQACKGAQAGYVVCSLVQGLPGWASCKGLPDIELPLDLLGICLKLCSLCYLNSRAEAWGEGRITEVEWVDLESWFKHYGLGYTVSTQHSEHC